MLVLLLALEFAIKSLLVLVLVFEPPPVLVESVSLTIVVSLVPVESVCVSQTPFVFVFSFCTSATEETRRAWRGTRRGLVA